MLRLLSCPGKAKLRELQNIWDINCSILQLKVSRQKAGHYYSQISAPTEVLGLKTEGFFYPCFVIISSYGMFNLPEGASHLWAAGGCLAAKRIPPAAVWFRAPLADAPSIWKLVNKFLGFWSTGCSALESGCAASVKVGQLMGVQGWQGRRQHHRGRNLGLQELSEGSSSTRKTYSTTWAQSLGPYRAPPPSSPKLLPRQSAPALTHRGYEIFHC